MARSKVRGKAPRTQAVRSGSELDAIVLQMRKEFGDSVVDLARNKKQPARIPTGIFSLDMASCGGVFAHCITTFHGVRSSGKTTAALKAIRGAQRKYPDSTPVFIDQEHTFDPVWAAKLGVDLDRLLVSRPDTGEQAVDIAEAMLRTAEVSLVVVDSVAALIPLKEIQDSAEDQHVGIHAKLVTRLVRKTIAAFTTEAKRGHEVGLIAINQQRAGIGQWSPTGDPISLPGGKALGFYTALQVKFKNKENMSKDSQGFDMLAFNEHAFKVEKNKYNAGIRDGEFQLMRRASEDYPLLEGDIDDAGTMIAYAKKMGIYTGGGRSWNLELVEEEVKFGSADEAILYLYENPDKYWELRNHLIALHSAKLGMPQDFLDQFYA